MQRKLPHTPTNCCQRCHHCSHARPIASQSWTQTRPCSFAHSRRTQSSPQPRCCARHSPADSPQIAQSKALRPAQARTDSCERCPFETLHPAVPRTPRPPARADDVAKPSSPRRSSQSRPGAAPAPIAARRRIVPFAPFNLYRYSPTARRRTPPNGKRASPSKNRPEYLPKSKPHLAKRYQSTSLEPNWLGVELRIIATICGQCPCFDKGAVLTRCQPHTTASRKPWQRPTL